MLVGVNFRPRSAKLAVEYLKTGDALRLEREPDNPYDINAVRVMHDESGEFIGFVARGDAETIAPIMDGGAEVTCTVVHQNGIKEVHLEVEYADDAVGTPATSLPTRALHPDDAQDDDIPF